MVEHLKKNARYNETVSLPHQQALSSGSRLTVATSAEIQSAPNYCKLFGQ